MKSLITIFTLCLAGSWAGAAVKTSIPVDVNALAANGQARITATAFDINDASKVFDTDRESLARTPSINPAFVQVEFSQPQTVHGIRVRFTSDKHEWKVSAGDDATRLSETAKGVAQGEDPQVVMWDTPVSARVFRLDVDRQEGDDFVHILSWELLQPGEVSDLQISAPPADVKEDTVLRFTASVKTSDGRTLDVTRDARWDSTTPGVETWTGPNAFRVRYAGEAVIRATYEGLTGSVTVPVSRYTTRNTAFDLNATYIERLPRIDYDANKATGGWPARGQAVEWVAHMRNWGEKHIPEVGYRWILDGKTVGSGVVNNWRPGTEATVSLPWKWEKKRHTLSFVLDPEGRYVEQEHSRGNNQVTVATDALAVGFWVEDGLYRYMRENQREYGDGANSFEDWGQRQMARWNQMFEQARFGTSPQGMTDRVRLDHVVLVPSGGLPLQGGLATNNPERLNKTVDLMWGFAARDYDTFWKVFPSQRFRPMHYEYGLIHELNHARYVIDAYGFDVHPQALENVKDADGKPLLGTPAMPHTSGIVHDNKYRGMMDSTHYFSEHEAYAWNRIAGQRARKGNQNGPGDIGDYLTQDLPESNRVRFVDQAGKPLAGASVAVHRSYPMKDAWYGKSYRSEPDLTYTTNADGWITLPRNPFWDGRIPHTYGHAASVMLLVVKKDGVTRTAFVEVSDFNLQHFRGYGDEARYEVALNTAPDNSEPGSIRPLIP